MKNSTVVLTMCLGFACPAFAEERPPIRPELVADPLPGADAATYPFTVIYESDVPLDLESLGDDDVIIGTQTLLSFRREIGQPPTLARFVSAQRNCCPFCRMALAEVSFSPLRISKSHRL